MKRALRIIAIVLVMLTAWILYDLGTGTKHSIRRFDPHDVAALETRMWRSYYEHRRVALFTDLVTLLRRQYEMPFWRACFAGFHAARAAVVFQRGHERPDYELALPDLIRYYRLIHDTSQEDFPIEQVAKLELEWWIVHRQRAQHQPGDLARALAAEQAVFYAQPQPDFVEHAQARAEAMDIRDSGESNADWSKIGGLLDRSWTSLAKAVNR